MPRPRNSLPPLRNRNGTGVVDYYDPGSGTRRQIRLGPWGAPETNLAYRRFLADLEAARVDPPRFGITVAEICTRFQKHARVYYLDPRGKPTSEVNAFYAAILVVLDTVDDLPAAEFGPKALLQCRSAMIRKGWTRQYVNSQIRRIRQVWAWAVEQEFVSVDRWQTLCAVKGLGKGRSPAPEGEGVSLPNLRSVASVIRLLTSSRDKGSLHQGPSLAAMVRFQWLTGCRCQDVCRMRANEIDRSDDVWIYRPPYHKGTHRGKPREVFIGPKAQRVLAPWLLRAGGDGVVFGNRSGKEYSKFGYARAILKACRATGAIEWTPLQLRHAAGTRFRRLFGLEKARVLLGHANTFTTEIYAERDRRDAVEAMRRAG
ncbi:MAG: site-specific integrase [Bacteroidales bacterium]|nr:site-specific integrase [Bacteroidales bacterium]